MATILFCDHRMSVVVALASGVAKLSVLFERSLAYEGKRNQLVRKCSWSRYKCRESLGQSTGRGRSKESLGQSTGTNVGEGPGG